MAATQTKMTFEAVERKRRDFSKALKAYAKTGKRYHNPAHEMPADRYAGSQVLANRLELFNRLPQGAVIAETGAGNGLVSVEILNRAAPTTLHLFDADASCLDNEALHKAVSDGIVIPHLETQGLSLNEAPTGYFDALYLSGNHDLKATQALLKLAARKVKPKGVIMVQDYTVWSPISMSQCGVARAVNAFCVAQDWKLKYLTLQSMGYFDVMLTRG